MSLITPILLHLHLVNLSSCGQNPSVHMKVYATTMIHLCCCSFSVTSQLIGLWWYAVAQGNHITELTESPFCAFHNLTELDASIFIHTAKQTATCIVVFTTQTFSCRQNCIAEHRVDRRQWEDVGSHHWCVIYLQLVEFVYLCCACKKEKKKEERKLKT